MATAAVVKAEGSKTQADVDAAQALVTALPAGAEKDALQERLDLVSATAAVEKAEGSKAPADINAAQALVTALPAGAEKDALQERLDLVSATVAVEKAEGSKAPADINAAQALVTALPAGLEKDALQERLDNIATTTAAVELDKLTGATAITVDEVAGQEDETSTKEKLKEGLTVATGYTLSITDFSYDATAKVATYKLTVTNDLNASDTATSTTNTTADVTTAAVDPILEEARFITDNKDVKLVFTKTLLSGTTIKFNNYDGILDTGENAFDFVFSGTGAKDNVRNTVIITTPANVVDKVAAGNFTYGVTYHPADGATAAYWEVGQ